MQDKQGKDDCHVSVFSPFEVISQSENEELRIALNTIRWIPAGPLRTNDQTKSNWLDKLLCEVHDEIERKYRQYLPSKELSPQEPERRDLSEISSQRILTLLEMIQPILKFKSRGSKHKLLPPKHFPLEEVMADLSLIHRNIIFTISSSSLHLWSSPVGKYFFPNRSLFILDDLRRGLKTCSDSPRHESRYRTIVVDPPWSNKSAKRGRVYQTSFDNEDLIQFGPSLQRLYHPLGCLVAIWITNNPTIHEFVLKRLLAAWGLDYLDTWWWIKLGVTSSSTSERSPEPELWYQPIHSIHSTHRKPYERVIIASTKRVNSPFPLSVRSLLKRKYSSEEETRTEEELCSSTTLNDALLSDTTSPLTQPVVDSRVKPHVIFSFPIRHSWKPPLQSRLHETLASLFPMSDREQYSERGVTREGSIDESQPEGEDDSMTSIPDHEDLELFARELREGCMSIGNEILFHQAVSPSVVSLTHPLLSSSCQVESNSTEGLVSPGFLSLWSVVHRNTTEGTNKAIFN
jgi:N6-adenosine-specific RNA methylase IME4